MKTVEEFIFQNATLFPNKTAIKTNNNSITYLSLVKNILSARNYFKTLPNYTSKRHIILNASKSIEFIVAYFGAHLANLIVSPLSSDISIKNFEFITKILNPLYIVGFDKIETNYKKISFTDFKDLPITNIDITTNISFPSLNSIADVLFTTGTTGVPKGVLLSFKNEATATLNINSYIKNKQEDIELVALPINHSFGLGRIRCCLSNAQTIIFINNFANIKKLFSTIKEEEINGLAMVPSAWKFINKMSGNKIAEFSNNLKYIEFGSEFLSQEDKQILSLLLPKTKLIMHYGLTEASRSSFLDFHKHKKFLDSIGQPSPNTIIDIFDEKGNILNYNQEGEICIKGKHISKGYLNSNNNLKFFNNYIRTGDYGFKNSEGYLFLICRKDEIINIGGKKVSPLEIEKILLKFHGIKECACTSIKDSNNIFTETIKAYIVKENKINFSDEDIKTFLHGKIEGYKIPTIYEFVDKIPKTYNGKIQRGLLH